MILDFKNNSKFDREIKSDNDLMSLFVLTKKSIKTSAFQLYLIFLLFYMYKYTYLCNFQEPNIISCLKK